MNMQSFFLGIAEISLGMSLLLPLMLLVLRFIGRKFTAGCRYILWTLVLLRLAISFSFGFLPALIEVPVEPINEIQIEVQPDITVPVPEYTPPQISQGIAVQPQRPVQSPVVPSVHEFPEPEEQPSEVITEQPPEVTWEQILNILTAVYCAGAALFFGWNIFSYITDNRITPNLNCPPCKRYELSLIVV